MKKILLLGIMIMEIISSINAQKLGYDEKIDLGNGLYKVKDGIFYGIIDQNDNVVVSLEYQDILFHHGKGLLTKNNMLVGVIDSTGMIKNFEEEYRVYPQYRQIYEGYILVSPISKWRNINNKWGYITEDGEPLQVKSKIKGVLSGGKKKPTLFDAAIPFVDGISSIYLEKTGWKHIDVNGQERYILANKNSRALFRSSVYKNECVIVTEDGIKLYQEDGKYHAVVKRILANSVSNMELVQGSKPALICEEGVLSLDSLGRVVKFENNTDSIVFIKPLRKVIVKKADTIKDLLVLKDDIKIKLSSNYVKANSKGRAYLEVIIKNESNSTYKDVSILLKCIGNSRRWSGDLEPQSNLKLSFNVPAKFSASEMKRKISINIVHDEDVMEEERVVTIKRYTPVRSR